MKSSFVIWDSKDVPNACALSELVRVADDWELVEGVSRVKKFPKDAAFRMDPDFPRDTLLVDNLINTDRMIVASARLKAFIEARRSPKVEYLPVTILNHKGRPASRDYFIIHPIEPVDCLDVAKSGAKRDKYDPDTIESVKRLVIDEARVDQKRELFRPKAFCRVILARRELAEAIDAQGFTGIRWKELKDFGR